MNYGVGDCYAADWGCVWLHGHKVQSLVCGNGLCPRLNTGPCLWCTVPMQLQVCGAIQVLAFTFYLFRWILWQLFHQAWFILSKFAGKDQGWSSTRCIKFCCWHRLGHGPAMGSTIGMDCLCRMRKLL